MRALKMTMISKKKHDKKAVTLFKHKKLLSQEKFHKSSILLNINFNW